jgi:UDP-N-acetylmuramate dehydrogenase
MDWLNGFAERVRRDEPLAGRLWYKLGGTARYFFAPESVEELQAVWRQARAAGVPVRVLGGGANTLVRDTGFDGLVLRLDAPAFTAVRWDGPRVVAGAGVDLLQLTRDSVQAGLSGLEALAGVPGTVGGATVMNAGGKFGEFADVVESATLLDETGAIIELSRDQLGFGYRRSAVGGRVVLAVTLRLVPAAVDVVRERFQEIWRIKTATQPFAAHSAGCVFRNPPQEPAGKLIDRLGLKGTRCGQARVSERHGNFIVADDGARAEDVLTLAEQVRATVRQRTGIALELEIDVW